MSMAEAAEQHDFTRLAQSEGLALLSVILLSLYSLRKIITAPIMLIMSLLAFLGILSTRVK